MNRSIDVKIVIAVLTLMLFVVTVSPDSAFAGTRVTFYFAGGVVVGGAAIFFSIFIGDRHHSKSDEKKDEDKDMDAANSRAGRFALNTKSKQFTEEDISRAGMVKVLEW